MDDKLELKDGTIWIMEDIKKTLQQVYDHYRTVCNQNDYLRKEIENVKSEKYTDRELSKMKEEYERMKKEYYLGFPISEKEDKKIREWINKQTEGQDFKTASGGAIGGRFHYEFIPTSIGTIGTVIDGLTGEKFTFQEP